MRARASERAKFPLADHAPRGLGKLGKPMSRLFALISGFFQPRDPGARGERAAAKFLKREGYRVVARNYRTAMGEIDLVAEAPDGRTIVVVEVKCNSELNKEGNPRPEVRVDLGKQKKLAAMAMQMVRRWKLADRPVRFDVIGVDLPAKGQPVIRHHVAAFESRW
jgi:putative endonuclease